MRKAGDLAGSPRKDVLSEALRRCRGAFLQVGLFSFFINLLMLAGPLYMLQVYDRVLSSGKVETLFLLTVMVAGALLAMAALETVRTMLTVRIGAWLAGTMGPFYLDAGIRARLAGRNGGGQAFRDLTQVQTFIATQGMRAFFDFPWTPIFIAVIWLLHPWLGIFALCVAVFLLILSVINEWSTRGPLEAANAGQLASNKIAETAIENADAVRAMAMTGSVLERWQMRNREVQRDLMKANERGAVVTGIGKFARLFAQSAILGLGAYLVLGGEATPGVMIAASILLGRALAPVDTAMTAWKNFTGARFAYGRLKALAASFPPEPRRISLPAAGVGRLGVDNLTVFGPNGAILRAVSFEVSPGEVVAVIGPSAAGKSTLCRSIVGLARPNAGTIRLDGIEIGHFDPERLGQSIGYLPQDVGLFAGTIRENIARLGHASDEMVIEAARLAHAHDMISQMPDGYDTVIGDRGAGLSAGQRQRIGLARAVLGAPPLVVLDEPNANLDTAGEAALTAAVVDLKQRGSTLLIIGHRPSTIAQCDKVLLLQGGRVTAFGPRLEVIEKLRAASEEPKPADRPPEQPPREAVEGEQASQPGGQDGLEGDRQTVGARLRRRYRGALAPRTADEAHQQAEH